MIQISYYDRRSFLSLFTKALLAIGVSNILTSCTTFDYNKDYSKLPPEEFPLKSFTKNFIRNDLYNGRNPNLQSSISVMHTFKGAYFGGWTPGICWDVRSGTEIVAAAPGQVYDAGKEAVRWKGSPGGVTSLEIEIGHPNIMSPFATNYRHLDEIYVKSGQIVERGQAIGKYTKNSKTAKLMFKVDKSLCCPNNYGTHHSYMEYLSDIPKENLIDNSDLEQVKEKRIRQMQIVHNIYVSTENEKIMEQKQNMHFRGHYGSVSWSTVEHFKYIKKLYKTAPFLFPKLTQKKFESMEKEFYNNQPILLTLPWKKNNLYILDGITLDIEFCRLLQHIGTF